MTVSTIYASTTHGYTNYSDASWSTCYQSSTGSGYSTSSLQVGAGYNGEVYYCTQSYLKFDVSSITGTVSAANALPYVSYVNAVDTTYKIELREFNWGTDVTTSDHSSASELAGYTGLFYGDTVISATGYYTLLANSSATYTAIENASTLSVVVNSIRNRVAQIPSVYSYYIITSPNSASNKPYLSVTWAPTVTGTAVGSLGAITGTALGAPVEFGIAASNLGAVTGTGTGSITRFGVVSSSLGAVTATATAVVEKLGTASSTLGEVTGTASGLVAVIGSASSTLGELTAAANGVVTVIGQAAGTLGAVVGTANGSSYKPGTGVGLLGGVTGTAVGTSLTIVYGYGGSVLGGILGQCVAEAQTMENVILISGGTRSSVVASDNDAILRSAVRSGIA